MPRTTFIAVDPTGAEHTRTSRSRTYTHAILVRDCAVKAMARAQEVKVFEVKNGQFYLDHLDALTPRERERSRRMLVEACGTVEVTAQQFAEARRDQAVKLTQAAIDRGDYDAFKAVSWCGRPDLVEKRRQEWDCTDYRAEVIAVPVTVKGA